LLGTAEELQKTTKWMVQVINFCFPGYLAILIRLGVERGKGL
jgi:hypothetical protein